MSKLGISVTDLLAQASAAAGTSISQRQLERWEQAGLLPPRLPQEHVTGVRGSVGGRFPATALAQLITLRHLLDRERSFDAARFWLWWEGFTVSLPRLRRTLAAIVPAGDLRQHAGHGDDLLELAERLADACLRQSRHSPLLRFMLRQLGRNKEALRSALVLHLRLLFGDSALDVLAPGLAEFLDQDHADAPPFEDQPPPALLFQALGLAPRGLDTREGRPPVEAPPRLVGTANDLVLAMQAMQTWGIFDAAALDQIAVQATSEQLAEARRAARIVVPGLAVIAQADALSGQGKLPPVLGVLLAARSENWTMLARCVLEFVLLRQHLGPEPLAQLLPTIEHVSPQAQALVDLFAAVPQLAPYRGRKMAWLVEHPNKVPPELAAAVNAWLDEHSAARRALETPP